MFNHFSKEVEKIVNTIISKKRISIEEVKVIYKTLSLSEIGVIADYLKQKQTGKQVTFVQNIHIEPTNVCVFNCKFCSFSTTESNKGWSYSIEEILKTVTKLNSNISEIHIVGGSNPKYNLTFYTRLIKQIKSIKPNIYIKAFTASEISYLSQLESISTYDTLNILKDAGINGITGGGAEILNDEIRKEICPHKINSQQWLEIHQQAHLIGLTSTCTMLYGHIETIDNRLEHLEALRNLQDKTQGFQAFIPLKFKHFNNELSYLKETNSIDDLKVFAISRIFLDNIKHIKAYWPAYGKDIAQMALRFGADDIDGTISDSTKIYSKAGADEQTPQMSIPEIIKLIEEVGYKAVERDALFNKK
jgi:aminodeoxyfutalosine synthase